MTTCLVLGGAACLWDDVAAFMGVDSPEEAKAAAAGCDGLWQGIVACNEAGLEWPGRLDCWVSLHPQFFLTRDWLGKRKAKGLPAAKIHVGHSEMRSSPARAEKIPPGTTITRYQFPGVDNKSGTSGLFAAKVALCDLGFDNVVLCGIPMTATPHLNDRNDWVERPKTPTDYQRVWKALPAEYLGRMRSMSGWTKELLGAPELKEKANANL